MDSEEIFRSTFEHAAVGICHVKPGGRYLWVNKRMCEIFGYTRDEFLRLSFRKVVHPDDLADSIQQIEKLQSGDTNSFKVQKRYLSKNGSVIWANRTVSLIRDSSGNPLYFIGVIEDITDRVQAEKALRESQERYSLAVKAGNVGVWDLDLANGNIYIDPPLKALLGYGDHQIANHIDAWRALVHPDDREAFMKALDDHIQGNIPQFEMEHRMLHGGGSIRWFQTKGYVVKDVNDKPCRILGTHTDITKLKITEEKLKKHQDHLETLIKQRTKELEKKNAELTFQARKLEELNSALRVLLEQREKDKKEFESKIINNFDKLILPYLNQLAETDLTKEQSLLLEIALANLKDLFSSFALKISEKLNVLTPREIQIASLVKDGRASKEIADLLNLSVRCVESHRYNLRKKLGLKGKNQNLRSYLLSST